MPGLALLGAGTFALSQYVPKLQELAHLASLKVVWSRSQVEASFTRSNERQTLKELTMLHLIFSASRRGTLLLFLTCPRKNHNQRRELNRHVSRSKFLHLSARKVQ